MHAGRQSSAGAPATTNTARRPAAFQFSRLFDTSPRLLATRRRPSSTAQTCSLDFHSPTMKVQALFLLAAVTALVAAEPNPIKPLFSSSEDAIIEDVAASTDGAPAPVASAPHLTVAAALKKPTKHIKRRNIKRNTQHLTAEQKKKLRAKLRARKAKMGANAHAASNTLRKAKTKGVKVASAIRGGKPIKKATKKPVRKIAGGIRKPAARRPKKTVAQLQAKIASLPAGSPLRARYERVLAAMTKPKTATLMSTAAAPGAHKTHLHSSPAGLVPFVDPPFPAAIQHGADGSVRLVRKGLTAGHGVIHKYGFQTAKPLAIPAGTKYVTFLAKIKAQTKKPAQRKPMKMVGKAPPRPGSKAPVCHKSDTAITVFHGGKPLGGLRFPKGSHGSNKYETLRLRVPVSRLSASSAPITLQAAHDHASTTKCMDHSILQLKGFKVQFHDTLPVRKPKTAAAGAKAKFSVSESGYDYASFDDSWDETYDDMWEDNYDDGDFSVSEDAAYEGDDMWEDNYDEGFSVSEDAAYDGDDMWEDNYDDEGFSLEDSYDEDAAADDEYDGGDFSLEDSYDEDAAADDEYDGGDYSVEDSYDEDAADEEY
ncbi:hypothetical protein AMAG_17728 [Allomyces macrogynus ATCC 38327]|uniref:Uncharacterized protein n=1 Tax=Allomyces macrogynus (strain ATCC 38327) TaxID=578462 RepID=A0A0L0RXI4_ALLM3|nr:hypothetical protein AMAG_17728 [Allomyces macrogynus ATCC 38327]|eukprot:KNE55033.1 hypothetical protein AMAG_17728 [Allomyces macrogynus ATCC 38327]